MIPSGLRREINLMKAENPHCKPKKPCTADSAPFPKMRTMKAFAFNTESAQNIKAVNLRIRFRQKTLDGKDKTLETNRGRPSFTSDLPSHQVL